MKLKLLIVNLQDPSKTKYHNYKDAAFWLWGRRFNNYMFVFVSDDNQYIIKPNTSSVSDLHESFIMHFSNNPEKELENYRDNKDR